MQETDCAANTEEKEMKEKEDCIRIVVAEAAHEIYVDTILNTIREAAKKRGTGIAERTHEYVATKMKEGKAILALDGDKFAGFSYIETWGNKHYVTTSGLIVHPDYQGRGIAKQIKDYTFTLARIRWPHAKIFSLTSGDAVMKMNTALGYVPVSFNQLTDDVFLVVRGNQKRKGVPFRRDTLSRGNSERKQRDYKVVAAYN